jgi:hypothetical protein
MFMGGMVVEDDVDQLACHDAVLDGIARAATSIWPRLPMMPRSLQNPGQQCPALGVHQRLHALIHRLRIEPALAKNPAMSRLAWASWDGSGEMRQSDVDLAKT